MKRLRVLVLVHPDLLPPELVQGLHRAANQRMENRIRRGDDVAPRRPRRETTRRARRIKTDPRRDRDLEAGRRVDAARRVSRRRDLRSERRELPRIDARALYRLQSARPDAGARQGFVEDAGALPSHSGAGLRGVPDAPEGAAPGAAGLAADRQEPARGRLLRHLASLRRRYRREARRACQFHPRAHRHAGDRRAIYRGPRDLCRRARQRPAARAAGMGIDVRQHGRRRLADRHREGQARHRLSGAP